jgi:hypothetical protein
MDTADKREHVSAASWHVALVRTRHRESRQRIPLQPNKRSTIINHNENKTLTFLTQKVDATDGLLHLKALLLLASGNIPKSNRLII